jgi:hypothetical protein
MPVVGVLAKISWNGGARDPLVLDFCLSQENAFQVKTLQQTTLKNTSVKAVNFAVVDYDQETKTWFTAFAPVHALSGIIAGKENPELDVDPTSTPVKDGIEVTVYPVRLSVAPAGSGVYALNLATSSSRPVVKSWGAA